MPTIAMQTDEGLPVPAAEAPPYPADGVMEQVERQVEATEEEPAHVDGAPAPPAPPAAPEEEEDDDDDVVDVINESLNQLLAKAQEESEAADDAVAKKREELEAAEADAEEKVERMDELREQARALADDEQWQGMYHRLRAWSKAQGHCNPRRNWQSKIDAEEKACGNWAGKQRRDERQGKLNPFKKAALDRIGFSFDPRKQGWEEFRTKLEAYVSKNGKLTVHRTKGEKEAGIQRQLLYYQKMPKRMLGLFKDSHVKDEKGESVRREMENSAFTQDRIDVLTEAGVEWGLNTEQVESMKEKGLIFPVSALDGDVLDQTLVGLEKHAWLTSFEALVEFKKRYGHTYATEFNSSEELGYWASEQRKKMNQLKTKSGGKAIKDKAFIDYQAEMLRGIGFLYLKPDVEWMENYERLSAFKRLFGTVAVTDKFCCFETLHQWLDENKRFHLKLPTFKPRLLSWAGLKGNVAIPPSERKELLDVLGVFDIPIGDEDIECRKSSNYFFRDAEQVSNVDATYLSRVREERRASVLKLKEPPSKEKESAIAAAQELANKAKSLHERCREVALTGRRTGMNSEKLDPQKERDFFIKRGATVAASVAERFQCADRTGKYSDGRPTSLCRLSNCFANHAREGKIFLCPRHFHMIEVFYRGELRRLNPPSSDEPASKLQLTNSEPSNVHACPSCEKEFASYGEAAKHRKDCGTVEVATEIPLPASASNEPTWTTSPLPHSATGEAKVLAEHYRRMVWMVTSQYRQKLSEEAPDAKQKHVAIALGELGDKKAAHKSDDTFEMTEVKFPSKADEIESVRLFRRCGGPLAATVSGREKLVREGEECYGDGRRLCFCRVLGCQTEYSTDRYVCNWHHAMIGYNDTSSAARKRKLSPKTSEAPSAKKHKSKPAQATTSQLKAPASVSAYVRPSDTATGRQGVPQQPMHIATNAQNISSISTIPVWHRNAPSKYLVLAPPGKLGLDLANCQGSSYVEVKAVAAASPLKGKVAVGDRIISVCQQLLWQKDVTQVVAILNQNIASVRSLEMMRIHTSGSARETKTGLDATTPRAEGGSSIESGKSAAKPAATSEAVGSVPLPGKSPEAPTKAEESAKEPSVSIPAVERAEPSPQSATEPPAKSCEENKTDSSPSAMAVEPPLESADVDVERFMDC